MNFLIFKKWIYGFFGIAFLIVVGWNSFLNSQNKNLKQEIIELQNENNILIDENKKYIENLQTLGEVAKKKESLSKEIVKEKIKIVKVKDDKEVSPILYDASEFIINRLRTKDSNKE